MPTFEIKYYDDEHAALLKASAIGPSLDAIAGKDLSIDDVEYWTYANFKHQKDRQGWRTYDDLRRAIPIFKTSYEAYFTQRAGNIRANFPASETDRGYTEGLAVGSSLSTLSHALGLHEADWEKIDEGKLKDLDFQKTVAKSVVVEVECKGTVSDETGLSSVSSFKSDILNKKRVQRTRVGNNNCLIGTITRFPTSVNLPTTVYLLDPPSYSDVDDPDKYGLLSRLKYYLRELKLIYDARFLIALANRIDAIALTSDYSSLDKQSLLTSGGEPMVVPSTAYTSRTVDEDRSFFGEIIPFGGDAWFFYGFDIAVIGLMINMNYDKIMKYKNSVQLRGSRKTTLVARAHNADIELSPLPNNHGKALKGQNRREFKVSGELFSTLSGRVFGEVFPTE